MNTNPILAASEQPSACVSDAASCSAFLEDNAICDDVGEPKGQCVCGWHERDHKSSDTLETDSLDSTIRDVHDGYFAMTNLARKLERERNNAQKVNRPSSEMTCSAGWLEPETAPRDGTQILGDFGYPWTQLAAWNTNDEKWSTASMMAQDMYGGSIDIWFETEYEAVNQLKRWMRLPSLPNAAVELPLPGSSTSQQDIPGG